MSILYYDLWAEYSDMEVRNINKLRAYDINPVCTYPRQRFIPELKRNGSMANTTTYRLTTFHGYPFRQLSRRNAVEGRAISHVAPLHPQSLT